MDKVILKRPSDFCKGIDPVTIYDSVGNLLVTTNNILVYIDVIDQIATNKLSNYLVKYHDQHYLINEDGNIDGYDGNFTAAVFGKVYSMISANTLKKAFNI